MVYMFTIHGRLPSLNDYISAERANRYKAAKMKADAQELIIYDVIEAGIPKIRKPVFIYYTFYERNKRRDKDNISGIAHKFIQDALVQIGILLDDKWENIKGYEDHFEIDARNPRIEVLLREEDAR